MDKKEDIRTRVLALRSALSKEEVVQKSTVISNLICQTKEYQTAEQIFCYMDFRNEVKTSLLIEQSFRDHKKVFLPKIEKEKMEFYQIETINQVEKGHFGILEPNSNEISKYQEGLVLMPGSAFDQYGNRIGYGKGYYDQYLAKHPKLIKFALAFQLQVVDLLPAESHDIKVDRIFTEQGELVPFQS